MRAEVPRARGNPLASFFSWGDCVLASPSAYPCSVMRPANRTCPRATTCSRSACTTGHHPSAHSSATTSHMWRETGCQRRRHTIQTCEPPCTGEHMRRISVQGCPRRPPHADPCGGQLTSRSALPCDTQPLWPRAPSRHHIARRPTREAGLRRGVTVRHDGA